MKNFILRRCFVALTFLLVTPVAMAGLLFPYNRLALKDLDQMTKLVKDKIQESRKEKADQIVPLKEALQAIYSRPNEDFLIEKIVSPLRNELDEHDAYEDTTRALVKEAIGALKNPKAFGGVAQVTYGIFLENLMAEMKPHAADNFEHSILVQIRDAKIELSKEAKNERRLKMMKELGSPSDVAAVILKESDEAEAKKKAAAEEAAKAKAVEEKKE